ncbi:calcium-binding and coiled-coil domain-containing protein 2 [Numida meleagris]|uniref:calcium-binding and coiled-coil domain-containing protein 2 n=1 Tax=Numida meleagris TaxID=8996 RepID=UPI000B3DE9E1|nr:calcium-binding and coiled-coil domain-containing protein 2 [Numida meleagris]XP_021233498.1 calcium-binding and coiled-coil domain-containing protein 2 [Numida meleagris]
MDETSDEPPTSAVLLDNGHFSHVIFNNVEKFYVPGGDVTCHYTLTHNIVPRGKDWVGIFRVGWKTTREYYTFMWAPRPSDVHGDTAVQQQIQFKAYYLPKDDEYYQFCYIDQDGMIRGASVPFQFRAETEDDILVVTTQGEVEEIELQNKNLLQENEELQANCASLQKQNIDLQEDLKKTQELQNALESLRSNTEKLELELNSLKKENKHLKELNECREAELHQFKEQIQNVTSEKEHLETKLKTALDHVDQLQSQLLSYEKEIEDLVRVDHEKTKQCESLKEENSQLCMTITQKEEQKKVLTHCLEHLKGTEANLTLRLQNEQQQNSDLMKELEEQKRLFQILKAEKKESDEENQKLRKENDSLLRRFSQTRDVSSSSVVSQAHASVPAPEGQGFIFANPYQAAGANQEARATGVDSIRKCPICNDVFPDDVETRDYEAHVQSHLLECPVCNETFEKSNRQVYDDHMYCHSLE